MHRLKISHLDTPTALAQLTQNDTTNAAFYRFTPELELAVIKWPENMIYPAIGDEIGKKLSDTTTDKNYAQWLYISAHIAIASGVCLRQFGHIQLADWPETGMHPFVKLLLPIASVLEKPKNYRLITISYLIHQKTYIL